MLQLVASDLTIKADVTPETLLFDVHRLERLQYELQFLTTSVTMLVSLAHSLGTTKMEMDAALVPMLTEEIFLPERELDLEKMIGAISTALEHRSTLSATARVDVIRNLTQCSSPTDAVHKLM
jgi:hypothetical protein